MPVRTTAPATMAKAKSPVAGRLDASVDSWECEGFWGLRRTFEILGRRVARIARAACRANAIQEVMARRLYRSLFSRTACGAGALLRALFGAGWLLSLQPRAPRVTSRRNDFPLLEHLAATSTYLVSGIALVDAGGGLGVRNLGVVSERGNRQIVRARKSPPDREGFSALQMCLEI